MLSLHAADSHPIHVHLINIMVVKRCVEGGTCQDGEGVLPYETGWNDVVRAPPNVDDEGNPIEGTGFITTLRMKFDYPGIYQWHCHIISHEDQEMMRPLCVYDPTDLTSLNMCCPDNFEYDQDLWKDKGEIMCKEVSVLTETHQTDSEDDEDMDKQTTESGAATDDYEPNLESGAATDDEDESSTESAAAADEDEANSSTSFLGMVVGHTFLGGFFVLYWT